MSYRKLLRYLLTKEKKRTQTEKKNRNTLKIKWEKNSSVDNLQQYWKVVNQKSEQRMRKETKKTTETKTNQTKKKWDNRRNKKFF